MTRLFATDNSVHGLVLRILGGLIIFPHGAQKLLGWFGGYGLEGTLGFLTGQLGLPAPVALLVILAESVGAVLLVAGLFTRVWAFLLGATMIGAIATLHAGNGFFMNWNGNQAGEGIEYNLLALGYFALLTVYGAGRWSLDAVIARRLESAPSPRAVPVTG